MNDQTPDLLDRLDSHDVGSAPVDALMRAGRAARQRRRRLVGGAAVALMFIVVGASVAIWQRGIIAADTPPTTGAGQELDVRAFSPTDRTSETLLGEVANRAVWNEQAHTVIYGSSMSYSSSCPPNGAATMTSDGAITLVLQPATGGEDCTMDAGRVLVIIQGVTSMPSTLTVTDSGDTISIPVGPWAPDRDILANPTAS